MKHLRIRIRSRKGGKGGKRKKDYRHKASHALVAYLLAAAIISAALSAII